MTSRLDMIRQLCAGVVSNTTYGISETWEHRHYTGKPSDDVQTYSPWADVDGIATQGGEAEMFDQEKNTYKRFMKASFRVAEGIVLRIGDQLRAPDSQVWNIIGVLSSGPGTIAYSIGREIGTVAGPDRKGPL